MCSSKQSTIIGPIDAQSLRKVFIIGHCRYRSFLTICLLGVAFEMSGKVLLDVPGHILEG